MPTSSLVERCCVALLALLATPCFAQSRLSDPDFSSMYASGGVASVARERASGWTFVGGATFVNGARTCGAITRVNDNGQIDPNWCTDETFSTYSLGEMMVTSGNTLLVQKGGAWHRASQNTGGGYSLWPLDAYAGAYALTPAADGNIYLLQRSGAQQRSVIRRLRPDGWTDADWSMPLDAFPLVANAIAVASDGSIAYIEERLAQSPTTYAVVKRSVNGDVLWRAPVPERPEAIVFDPAGRVYVSLAAYTSTAAPVPSTLLRLSAEGTFDATWPPAMLAGNQWQLYKKQPFSGELILTRFAAPGGIELLRFDPTRNVDVARTSAPSLLSVDINQSGDVVFGEAELLRLRAKALSGPTLTTVTTIAELGGAVQSIRYAPWGDGWVVAGTFRYWFEGVRYENVMRLDAQFRPDPTWRPEISSPYFVLLADDRGGLIVGGQFGFGAQRNVVRFDARGRLDTQWRPDPDGSVYVIDLAADGSILLGGSFTQIGGVVRPRLARVSPSGQVDASWGGSSALGDDGTIVHQLVDLGASSTLVIWSHAVPSNDGWPSALWRVDFIRSSASGTNESRTLLGPSLARLPQLFRDPVTRQLFLVRPVDAGSQATVLARVHAETLDVDPQWPALVDSSTQFIFGADSRFLYVWTNQRLVRLDRATGVVDPAWPPPNFWLDTILPMSNGDPGLSFANVAYGTQATLRQLMVLSNASASAADRQVVEYFSRATGHFFITARANEQALLDGLPSAFTRTGMQMTVVDGSVTSLADPSNAQQPTPICRVFASAARGGSNTHFYGQRQDCQLLHRLSTFAYEGFDFATPLPAAGTCPGNAPVEVHRLYNDRSAQNDANHRYVVSTARRAEMIGRGWRDEGLAFCARAATDSRPWGTWP